MGEKRGEVNCKSQVVYFPASGLLCFLSFVINVLFICCFTVKEEITVKITVGENGGEVNSNEP